MPDWPKIGELVHDLRLGAVRIIGIAGPSGRSAWRVRLADGRALVIERPAWVPGDELSSQKRQITAFGGHDPLSPTETMRLLGLAGPRALAKARQARCVLGLPTGDRFVYPAWQFTPAGALLPGLEVLLATPAGADPWGLADLLTSPTAFIGGRAPIDALAEGDPAALHETLLILDRVYNWP